MTVIAVQGRTVTLSTGEVVQWPASAILPAVGQEVFASDFAPPTPWGLMTMAQRAPGHGHINTHRGPSPRGGRR